ncbi:hypothetical protein HZS_516 [Henneguya salminicola]|nr:hypothetical protein HZS_516 [Henneguya salminicola]
MQYNININNFKRETVDFTNRIPLQYYFIYDHNGAHGNIGRMIIYAAVEIYPVDINHYQRDFFIKVHSISWKKYKLTNGKCCSINTFEPCNVSCSYFFEFFIKWDRLDASKLIRSSKIKINKVSVYAVSSFHAPISKYNISVVLKTTGNGKIIDIAKIDGGEYSTVEAEHGINMKGSYDNFCINKCHAFPKIEYCDFETGNRNCYNGAEDIDCERKIIPWCNKDICNRKGICQFKNNKTYCKCNRAYNGKYCENLICLNDCNGNGYCINQGECACNSIYKGKLCDEYPCSINIVNPCKNGGICYQANNSIKCYCPVEKIHGKYCHILSCGKICRNGKCIFSLNELIFKCLCTDGWYGIACSIPDVFLKRRLHKVQMVILIVLLVSINMCFLIFVRYIHRRHKTF